MTFKSTSVQMLILVAVGLLIANHTSGATEALPTALLEDIRHLASDDKAGREPGSIGHAKAAAYLRHRYQQLRLSPLQNDYSHNFTFTQNMRQKPGTNLIGSITGTTYPESYIVFTAHYDHLGRQGRRIFNGADDNASGVAVMLAVAHHFTLKAPHHSLLFVATDAEESGLHGASALFSDPALHDKTLLLNINLDMLGNGGRKQTLYVLAKGVQPDITDALTSLPQMDTLPVRLSTNPRGIYRQRGRRNHRQDWRQASDHAAFGRADIPYLFFASDVHAHYHQTSDTIETINPAFVTAAAQAVMWVSDYVDANAYSMLSEPQQR